MKPFEFFFFLFSIFYDIFASQAEHFHQWFRKTARQILLVFIACHVKKKKSLNDEWALPVLSHATIWDRNMPLMWVPLVFFILLFTIIFPGLLFTNSNQGHISYSLRFGLLMTCHGSKALFHLSCQWPKCLSLQLSVNFSKGFRTANISHWMCKGLSYKNL